MNYLSASTLSLCIPTYNRSWYLEKALDCITSQRIFQNTDLVEVCISDNASTDDTPEVMARYRHRFGNKIVCHRNETNIRDRNFEKALSLGSGTFLKLCNDTAWYYPGMIEKMLEHVRRYEKQKPVLFFKESQQKQTVQELTGLDAFVDAVSYYMCSTNSFGIWKEDFDHIPDFSRFSSRSFAQTDVLLRLVAQKEQAVLIRDRFFFGVWPPSKGGYNFAQVFGDNYIGILRENGVGKAALKREQIRSLRHIVRYYFDFQGYYRFLKTGYMPYMRSYYRLLAFWLSFLRVVRKQICAFLQKGFSSRLRLFQKQWKNFYPFNTLLPDNVFPLLAVQAGRYASGPLHVQAPEGMPGILRLDDYVRLEQNVRFACGNKPTLVDKAVQIGKDTLIREGVHLGTGCIIEPDSVVDQDIPPFAIAGGKPARIKNWRFSPEVRRALSSFSLSSVSPESIHYDPDELFRQLHDDNIWQILKRFHL